MIQVITDNNDAQVDVNTTQANANVVVQSRSQNTSVIDVINNDIIIDEFINNLTGSENIVITKSGRHVNIGTKHFEFTQSVASNEWVINHNLNKRCPKVTLIDSAGSIYYPLVIYTDENNCTINLIGAMSGTAYLE